MVYDRAHSANPVRYTAATMEMMRLEDVNHINCGVNYALDHSYGHIAKEVSKNYFAEKEWANKDQKKQKEMRREMKKDPQGFHQTITKAATKSLLPPYSWQGNVFYAHKESSCMAFVNDAGKMKAELTGIDIPGSRPNAFKSPIAQRQKYREYAKMRKPLGFSSKFMGKLERSADSGAHVGMPGLGQHKFRQGGLGETTYSELGAAERKRLQARDDGSFVIRENAAQSSFSQAKPMKARPHSAQPRSSAMSDAGSVASSYVSDAMISAAASRVAEKLKNAGKVEDAAARAARKELERRGRSASRDRGAEDAGARGAGMGDTLGATKKSRGHAYQTDKHKVLDDALSIASSSLANERILGLGTVSEASTNSYMMRLQGLDY